ncbi:succinate dehydrogenase/fumarate reductase iron-sulfur subunit [Thermocrinis minervae]|uniref:Fumarate reductase iron-sulfur subunit n=1 Tax=Thermocrinis minervae TaxID=381751 RepID=A0A1M6SPJ2_9AQUI|nr:2Fe-2S iron-sulfur cluster-binding protein [Thermocrinis minervae]SHK46652.1 succinate dehydrogenase / fumarate reductase iron-sulfur subunit [Thermocrinis minervae]
MEVEVLIKRAEGYQPYTVEVYKGMTILDLLNAIKEKDPTLSYRHFCRAGVCGTCAVRVNSKPVLACSTKVEGLDTPIKIEPLYNFPVIKDLVVDHEPLIDRVKGLFSRNGLVDQDEWTYRSYECILCGVCDEVCPVLAESHAFGGPMYFLRAYKHIKEVYPSLKEKFIQLCTHCNNCSLACPKRLFPETAIRKEENYLQELGLLPKPAGFDFLSF